MLDELYIVSETNKLKDAFLDIYTSYRNEALNFVKKNFKSCNLIEQYYSNAKQFYAECKHKGKTIAYLSVFADTQKNADSFISKLEVKNFTIWT